MLYRNNTQYIIGFVDALIEEYHENQYPIKDKINYSVDLDFVDDERTEVKINFHVNYQKKEDDYLTFFILVPETTTVSGFKNLVEISIMEMYNTFKEVENDN